MLTAPKIGNMFKLNVQGVSKKAEGFVATQEACKLWHARLGNLGSQALKFMQDK
jgi:hypothetical protein